MSAILYVIHDSLSGRKVTDRHGNAITHADAFRLAAQHRAGYWLEGEWRTDTGRTSSKWIIWK